MNKVLLHCVNGLLLLLLAVQVNAQAVEARRPLIEVSGMGTNHRYHSDSDQHFQFGTPPIELTGQGYFGLTTRLTPYAGGELAAVHETITTSNLPASVVAAASTVTA
jgi:hypothetical protein